MSAETRPGMENNEALANALARFRDVLLRAINNSTPRVEFRPPANLNYQQFLRMFTEQHGTVSCCFDMVWRADTGIIAARRLFDVEYLGD